MNSPMSCSPGLKPLAIIGCAAKYSQEAYDVDRFWDFLLTARQSMTSFPKDRLTLDGYYHPDPEYAGTIHAQGAHFLAESPAAFDAAFFSVNKTEVASLDPQQRLVMENVYHALENAGIPMSSAVSSNTSVFVSGFNHDHRDRLNVDPEIALKHRPTGSEGSMISGRVSWFYDFKGASMTVDTACSSSMVAFHLACQNIILGESDTAVVSGVNVFGALNHILGMSYSGFLSPEGKCFTFDHRANGYSRGEGVGTVILKSLDKALADGNTIRAVVRGTALNSDGRTPGLTYPSGDAQVRLVQHLYQSVGLNPEDTPYVESHGTGTAAGDPIEVRSIARAFQSQNRDRTWPIYIGAVKPNIGHVEGGAGISGIIKAIMILESGIIPPNVNFEKVNPEIDEDDWNVRFPVEAIPWPTGAGTRRVSINCFGLSGTNAHCILEDAYNYLHENGLDGLHNTRPLPPNEEEVAGLVDRIGATQGAVELVNGDGASEATIVPKLLVFSGFDRETPERLRGILLTYLQRKLTFLHGADVQQLLEDIAYTFSERRSRFRWNSFMLASSESDVARQLASNTSVPSAVSNQNPPRIAFVFTGQGAQYAGMGRQLLQYPVFRESLDAADEYMKSLGSGFSLVDEIMKDTESKVDTANISHPACTAIQIALVDLLQSWNVRPVRVVGHSSGEIAAAYCAGKVSREAAWNVAYHRGRLTSHIPSRAKGGMLAVGLDITSLQPLVDQVKGRGTGELVVACFNSPKNHTVSGDETLILELQGILESKGVFARRLRTPNAYHSPHMNDIADDYLKAMGPVPEGHRVCIERPVRMFSTSTGAEVLEPTLRNEFWVHNLVSPVQFITAVQSMCRDGQSVAIDEMLEIGPHGALQTAVKDIASQTGGSVGYHAVLDRNDPTARTPLTTVGALAVRGTPVNIVEVNSGGDRNSRCPKLLVDLPPYPFDHSETSLYESRLTKAVRFRASPRHLLFGAPCPDSNPSCWSWKHYLRIHENPWLKDHVISGRIVFPGAGYLVMAIEATRQILNDTNTTVTGFRLRDVVLKAMLVVPDTRDGIETRCSVWPAEESNLSTSTHWNKFLVGSYDSSTGEWTENCTGYIAVDMQSSPNPVTEGRELTLELEGWSKAREDSEGCKCPLDFSRVCNNLESAGITFGPLFRNIAFVKVSGERHGVMSGTISVPDVAAAMPKGFMHPHIIHPATLDAALQAGVAAICDYTGTTAIKRGKVPAFIKEIWISSSPLPAQATMNCYGRASLVSQDTYDFDIRAWDAESEAGLISLSGIRLTPFEAARTAKQETPVFHQIEWGPDANFLNTSMLDLSVPEHSSYETEQIWFSELQLAATMLATDALRDLKGSTLPAGAPSHCLRFYELLKRIVVDAISGTIPSMTFDDWQKYNLDPDLKAQLYERVAERDLNGAVLVRMGTQIVPFLQQESDPLYHMFGRDDLMARYYDADVEMGPIPQGLDTILHSMRYTFFNLNVLEVGAGTGSFTARVLGQLCPKDGTNCIAQYDFTDVSPSFFEKAQPRLEEWARLINFRKLDLGADPVGQGFVEASYDLIVASNVLHATHDITRTLTRLRSLLKPGGKILFLEGVRQDTIYSNISFSALPGWWLGGEAIREWCPYIPTSQWQEYLHSAGFSGLDVEIPSSYYPEFNKVSVMLSTAVPPPEASQPRPVALITPGPEERAIEHALLNHIQKNSRFGGCFVVPLSNLSQVELRNAIYISLLELDRPLLDLLDESTFLQLKDIMTSCSRLIWVTGMSGPQYSLSTGLIRTLRWERDSNTLNLTTLAVNPQDTPTDDITNTLMKIIGHQFVVASDRASHWNAEYRLQGPLIETNRLAEHNEATTSINAQLSDASPVELKWNEIERPVKIRIAQPGAVDSLQWVTDNDATQPLGETEVEVNVHAVGINFRDLLTVMGELQSPQTTIGGEASGIVTRVGSNVTRFKPGDRVAYFGDPSYLGTFRTLGRADQDLTVQIPDHFSFEIAASMPVIYTTVIYALKYIARLSRGESILIHAAAGGVGQAAVQYAQLIGAEVLVTVSTVKKKSLLMEEYGIPEDHIFSSRDLGFADALRKAGGVDVILNSLAGEALHQSWTCLSPFGRFVEIGKRDLQMGGKLDMSQFLKNTLFSSVDLLTVAKHRPSIISELLQDMVHLWVEGKVRAPKPINVISYSSIQSGLRSLQMGQTLGKVVCVPNEEPIPVIPEPKVPYSLDGNATYILAGGLGGIGRSIAHRMASRGAKHLMFLSRSDQLTGAAEEVIATLDRMGCQSHIVCCDIADTSRLTAIIKDAQANLPPIKGCINCSVSWADGTFENMTHDRWQASLQPKVQGSWNLHQTLQSMPLEFFVMLSSVAGVVGNRSQSNYNAGNTFEDALARHRVSEGLPGASIDLGAVVSVGFMAENRDYVKHSLKIANHHSEEEMLSIIDYVLGAQSVPTETTSQLVCGISTPSAYDQRGAPPPKHLQYPMFNRLQDSGTEAAVHVAKGNQYNLQVMLAAASSEADAVAVILHGIQKKLSSVLSVAEDEIEPSRSIQENGVDSLIEMEFRTWLSNELGVNLSKGDLTTKSLEEMSVKIMGASPFCRL